MELANGKKAWAVGSNPPSLSPQYGVHDRHVHMTGGYIPIHLHLTIVTCYLWAWLTQDLMSYFIIKIWFDSKFDSHTSLIIIPDCPRRAQYRIRLAFALIQAPPTPSTAFQDHIMHGQQNPLSAPASIPICPYALPPYVPLPHTPPSMGLLALNTCSFGFCLRPYPCYHQHS
jgi:hypothetical protein